MLDGLKDLLFGMARCRENRTEAHNVGNGGALGFFSFMNAAERARSASVSGMSPCGTVDGSGGSSRS